MKSPTLARLCIALLGVGLVASPALAEGDVKKGKKVFNKCKACHFVDKEKNKVGPHLVGLFGRTAGAVEGYKYSKPMLDSGIVWSPETLAPYLANPKKNVPGTKMVFAGLKKEKQITDVIAYLQDVTKKAE